MAHVPTLGVQQQNHSWWLSFNPIWKNMKVKMRVIFPIKIGVKIPKKNGNHHLEILGIFGVQRWSFGVDPFAASSVLHPTLLGSPKDWHLQHLHFGTDAWMSHPDGFSRAKTRFFWGGDEIYEIPDSLGEYEIFRLEKNCQWISHLLGCPEVRNWLVNGLYWGCNPLTNLLLTFWTSK